jgi:cyclic beta-1,2-glucan glucanotransferase
MRSPGGPKTLLQLLSWRRSADLDSLPTGLIEELPLRAELFSVDQLERHARVIASLHQLGSRRSRDKLLPRLEDNQRVLVETYNLLIDASSQQANGCSTISI